MWIIPTNYPQSSVSAPDMVASSEDLRLQGLNIEQSLMWRSKPMRLQTCLRKWKRDSWFRHLSGRILKPCQHTAFESELMCLLAVIPASRLAAGLRKGTEDPRHLWPYIKRHIETIRPVRCLFENVEGHISLGLREVIEDLERLGYATTWGIFSAAEVGAPHQRKRVYILAHANGAGQQPSQGQPGASQARHNAGRGGEAVADTGGESGRGGPVYPRARNQGREASAARGEGVSPGDGQALADHTQSGGEDVPNANFQRLQRRVQRGRADPEGRQEQKVRPSTERGDQRPGHGRGSGSPVSGLGRGFDGPASWLDGSWEVGIERVTSSQNHRVNRLVLLGNGVVPDVAAKAWIVLNEQLASE